MAFEKCIEEVTKAVGRDLTDDELDSLFSGVEKRARRKLREEAGISSEDAYRQAADEFAQEKSIDAIIKKRNTALALHRRAEALDYVNSQFSDRPAFGLEALMVGVNRLRKGARLSAAAEQNALAGYLTRGFQADIEREGLWKVFVSGLLDREISKELWEIDRPGGKPGISGSDEAQRIAKYMAKWQDAARLEANKAGAWIKKSPGYIVRQSHSMFKIRGKGGPEAFREWRDMIYPLLDERTFDDVENVESFLRGVYDGLASGVHLSSPGGGLPVGMSGGRSVARSMSQDRLLHFRSADAWFDYNAKYGSGSLRESFLFGLQRSAKDTGLMRVWGPNPRDTYDRVFNELISDTKGDPDSRAKLRADRSWLDNRFAEIDGSAYIPGNVIGAKYSAVARGIESTSKLGFAMVSGFSDIPIAASELSYQGQGFLSSYASVIGSLSPKNKAEKEVLGMIGVLSDTMTGQAVARFSGHDDLPGSMSRLLRTFFKWNGLQWWTDTLRDGVTLAMSSRMADNSGAGWGRLDKDLKRVLELFGIDGDKWDMIRVHGLVESAGKRFITPEGIRNVPDEAIAGALESGGSKATKAAIGRYRDELERQLRAYFIDRAEYAIIEPDARTNAILRQGTRPGTPMGELARFIGQFKAFPTAVTQKTIGREIYGRGSDTLGEALRGGNGEWLGLAHLIVGTTVFGYISMAAKDVLKGKTPRDPTDPGTIIAAALQGGGLGIYGDYLFGEASRFGHSPIENAAGPGLGTAADIITLFQRARDGDDVASSALRFVISHTPGANLFYTKALLDYLIVYRIQEAMNPGYLRRMERRVKRQNEQKFLIDPSKAVKRRRVPERP